MDTQSSCRQKKRERRKPYRSIAERVAETNDHAVVNTAAFPDHGVQLCAGKQHRHNSIRLEKRKRLKEAKVKFRTSRLVYEINVK